MSEHTSYQLAFGGAHLALSIERTTRRRTVALSVGYDGIRVLAPRDLDHESIIAIVRGKAPWLLRKQALREELGAQSPEPEFVGGETFLYLGRAYRLKVLPRRGAGPATIRARGAHLIALAHGSGAPRASAVRAGLVGWYKVRARDRLPERMAALASKMGVPAPPIRVVDQSKRWGSCDAKGIVRVNWRLMMAPMALVDYVLAHELCHTRHHDHSRAFWRSLEVLMPDFQSRIRKLDRAGHRYAF